MRFHKLDLNLLVALDVLLAECSVTKAAALLHLSPSATSGALSRCREYFQDDLLVPVGRRMEPTPRALALRTGIRDLLTQAETVLRAEPVFDPAQAKRSFSLLLSDYNNALLAPALVQLVEQEAPEVRFDFLPQQHSQPPHVVMERGEADIVLIADTLCSPDHPREVILEDEFVCVVCASHPTIQGVITLDQFVQAGHVIMAPGPALQSVESTALQKLGIARRAEVKTFSFLALPALVRNTRRVATVHSRVAALAVECDALTLQRLAPPFQIPAVKIAMQWHRHRSTDPGLQWLRNMVRRAANLLTEDHAGEMSPLPGHPSPGQD